MIKNESNRHIRTTFFQVKSDQMKRQKIIELAEDYFEKKEPLLFKVPHQKALEYLDLLLWRFPQDSFLPHVIQDSPCSDLLAITASDENPNRSRSLFNLTPTPIENPDLFFTHIYEFEDLSSTLKK